MFKAIIVIIAISIAIVLGFAATRPDSFRVERSTSVKAPPEKVFALINDFHQWGAWSPWEKIDADLKRTYSGATSGIGAIYGWEGQKTGDGRMEILESSPSSKIKNPTVAGRWPANISYCRRWFGAISRASGGRSSAPPP